MITSNLVGGLGNYLFQIAVTYSLSVDNNDELVYNIGDCRIIHGHISTYLNNIFRKIKFVDYVLPYVTYEEPSFSYNQIEYKPNLKLNGYYQSEKYFLHNRGKILELFEVDGVTKKYIQEKYGDVLLKDICSLHVRRGDYIKLPNHHPVCGIDYYSQAVDVIGHKCYLIFSDDIQWCKDNLDFIPNKVFIEGNSDYQDLYLMSLCNDNIIANSSFSWWGSWLNINPNKKVVSPKKWFGSAINHETKDLIPNTWIEL